MQSTRHLMVLACVVGLVAAGCGMHAEPAEVRLAQAAARTAAAETARLSLEMHTEIGAEGGSRMDYTMVMDGALDFTADRAHLTMDMPFFPGAGSMEMISDGSTVYVRLPDEFGGADNERTWVRTDTGESVSMVQAFGFLGAGTGGDPRDILSALGAVEGSVTELGPEEIRGTSTLGYEADVAFAELWGDHPEAAAQLTDLVVPLSVWLDDEGRVRRLTYTIDLGDLAQAGAMGDHDQGGMMPSGTMTTTLDLYDLGEPVDIALPPEDQVTDEPRRWGVEERIEGGAVEVRPGEGWDDEFFEDVEWDETFEEFEDEGEVRAVEPEAEPAEPVEAEEP